MLDELTDPRERSTGNILLVLGVLAWLVLVICTAGMALLGLLAGYVVYLFTHSLLIAHLKGNGVELTREQFPDLFAEFEACCQRLQIEDPPRAYILNGGGVMNAFATRFLGAQYVVVLSAVVESMRGSPDGLKFYFGHELGHLRRKHLSAALPRWPVLWLPLIGAAYSRARERTCDLHGAACCGSPESAAGALAALAAGGSSWQQLNLQALTRQVVETTGFWMSFHELCSAYPWLTKRVAKVLHPQLSMPGRHPLAYALAAAVPYTGRMGGGFGLLLLVYVIGMGAAIAIPAYQDYTTRAAYVLAWNSTAPMRTALDNYYAANKEPPKSLAEAGAADTLPDGSKLGFNPDSMVLIVPTKSGALTELPSVDEDGNLLWHCKASKSRQQADVLPKDCR